MIEFGKSVDVFEKRKNKKSAIQMFGEALFPDFFFSGMVYFIESRGQH